MIKNVHISSFYRRLGYAALIIIVFALSITLIDSVSSRGGSPSSSAEVWIPVNQQLLENQIGLVGKIEASERRTLVAPFEGQIASIEASIGELVRGGQLIATLDIAQLDIKIRDAHTELLKAESQWQQLQDWENSDDVTRARRALSSSEMNLQNIQNELEETRRLYDRGIVPRNEVDSLERQLRSQRIDIADRQGELNAILAQGKGDSLRIAQMQTTNARINHDSLLELRSLQDIHAPFDGILLPSNPGKNVNNSRAPQSGSVVSQGTALFDIASVERLIATAAVEEGDLDQIHIGMPVSLTGDGFQGITLNGSVQSIGAQAMEEGNYSGGSTYEISVTIDSPPVNERQLIRLGMSARLKIVTYSNENGLAVPADAVHRDEQGIPFVIYRETMNSTPRNVSVDIGHAVPQGVEVWGIKPGYIRLPAQNITY
ncbi:efflux RND transporter periplasmic adaptor subunit [Vreelandella titanicae]|uniref:efflux RND transporter periplasmic adaptor subunit n=1 Tax=Vreelandella titanicae TaxID=664683 RepID=UPI001F20D366|nr:HlyD family efflux transporter periplasmic adaptor subunit [Halomonas titanicae]MCE7521257.1 HlyD family efflux transporter periplasmic adaptor subunit [Halomonas titanicae]